MTSTKDETEVIIRQNQRIWEETSRQSDRFTPGKSSLIDQITLPKLDNSTSRVIKVFNAALLDVAERAAVVGLKPMVVNAGSDNDPVTIVENGAIGTEWDIFRRSNLANGLNIAEQYPLREGKLLYCNDVTVFKNSSYKLCKPFEIAICCAPPLRRPNLVSIRAGDNLVEQYQNLLEQKRMQDTINKIFETALYKGHRCIIFDDYGCTKTCENPISEVINIFNQAIANYPVKYVFFAVKESEQLQNTKKVKSVYKNYTIFNNDILRY